MQVLLEGGRWTWCLAVLPFEGDYEHCAVYCCANLTLREASRVRPQDDCCLLFCSTEERKDHALRKLQDWVARRPRAPPPPPPLQLVPKCWQQ